MPKTYVIADIHGRYDLLSKAIDLIDADAGGGQSKVVAGRPAHKVIVLGDFVDRGPNVMGVITLLRFMQENEGWTILQGNHESMMVEVLSNPDKGGLRWWFGNGGDRTLASYGYTGGEALLPLKKTVLDDIRWLKSLPVWVGDRHRYYVHAGVPTDKQIGECETELLQWMLYDNYNTPEHEAPHLWKDEPHCSGKHIVHGHHQHDRNPHAHMKHRTNLDSFAWHSGRLAIGVFDDEVAGGPVKVLDAIGKPYEAWRKANA